MIKVVLWVFMWTRVCVFAGLGEGLTARVCATFFKPIMCVGTLVQVRRVEAGGRPRMSYEKIKQKETGIMFSAI